MSAVMNYKRIFTNRVLLYVNLPVGWGCSSSAVYCSSSWDAQRKR